MDKIKYHPQQDVFRLIDGKKQRVTPYRFGQREQENLSAPKPQQQPLKGPYIKSIVFNGIYVITTAVDEKGKEIVQELPAVSGEPRFGDEFDYSKYRQELLSGPIPEGNYKINPQEVQRPTLKDDVVSLAGGLIHKDIGKFPGGRRSWGDCRIAISQSDKQAKETGRGNFFIHGGDEPGSLGCIDLQHGEKAFCGFIEKYRGKNQKEVPLAVKYLDEVKDVPDDEF